MIRDQHIPIMTNEILSFINRKKNLSILDCTFGGGGHSKKFLENGHFVTAIDQDDSSSIIAKQLKKNFPNIFFYKNNFKNLDLVYLLKRFFFSLSKFSSASISINISSFIENKFSGSTSKNFDSC